MATHGVIPNGKSRATEVATIWEPQNGSHKVAQRFGNIEGVIKSKSKS
jgi:hypothetical protein